VRGEVIGREDFISMKVFAGGSMNMVDATRAITAAGASLNLELVRRLAKRFGRDASESLEQLLKSWFIQLSRRNPVCPGRHLPESTGAASTEI
jgi:hypothetical protein